MQIDSEVWKGVAFWASSTVTAGGLVSLIGGPWINWVLQRKLENYKSQMQSINDATLERVKTEAEISIERFKKSYSLQADRQAEAIETIFAHLTDLHLALLQCVSPLGERNNDQELLRHLREARWTGLSHFRKKRLFLPQEVGDKVEAHYLKLSGVELRFSLTPRDQGRRADYWERTNKLAEEVEGSIAETLREIEIIFRQISWLRMMILIPSS